MVIDSKLHFWIPVFTACFAGSLAAAPRLQLASTSLTQVSVTQGSNGLSQTVDAQNIGDGSLNLQVTSSASWIVPSVGASHSCSSGNGKSCLPVLIALPTAALSKGTYAGLVTVYDPNAIDAPQYINVSVAVGTGVPDSITFSVPASQSAAAEFGTSSLVTTAVSTTATDGNWLAAAQSGGSPFSPTIPYTVSTAGLAAGDYTGSINVTGSSVAAENKTINVTLHVVAPTVTIPLAAVGGALNNTIYVTGESLPQGGIVALFGSQFITGSPAGATLLPLGTTLGGVQLLLNGQPVPLYYVSASQINFQVPYEAAPGAGTLQVVSNGTSGNTISVTIAKAVPRILQINDKGGYGIIVNAPDNSFAIPTTAGIASHPTAVGKVLTIYASGLGATNPAADSGAASPSTTLAHATGNPMVCFIPPTPFSIKGLCVTPQFAGLTPGFVGLFQVNVTVPSGAPVGDAVPISLLTDEGSSNTVNIAVAQ